MQRAASPDASEISPAKLDAACRALNCPVPEEILRPLGLYLALLTRWNRVMNLVGAKNWREALRLAADAFFLARFLATLPLAEHSMTWDLGAGAGLPGIPLRMVWQSGDYYMVESREKRAVFLQTVLAHLSLPRTGVVWERAEHFFARMLAQERPADCILSRAFMPWEKLLPFVAGTLAPGALVCITAKGPLPAALPERWLPVAQYAYQLDGAARFFWALRQSPKDSLPRQPSP